MKRFSLTILALFAALTVFAQMNLTNDPDVKTGKLDNGMTYYIRHNPLPKGRCEFYLATNAGAIQETPDQDGLAHFLEHMCFNGLKNLPGKSMLEYLQHIGAEFGRNINAGTGVEHTTYMLNNIPVTREGIIDTCLLVMHDYSHFVLLEQEEIDAERGVILEEKRTRNSAGWRMFEKSLPYLYGDSKYASCTLIGSEDNLKNFKRESIVNFYQSWYQPDMQAIIVVGDIDVDNILNKIQTLFADIPAPATPTVKNMPEVSPNEETVVGILTDAENTETGVEFLWKLGKPTPKEMNGTIMGFTEQIVKYILRDIMSERFKEITTKPDSPFMSAYLSIGNLCETCEVLDGGISCENGKTLQASEAFLTEVEKLRRYGIADDEFERAKNDILKSLKDEVSRKDTRKNSEFVNPILNNFFSGFSYMTPEDDLKISEMLFTQLNASVLNQMIPAIITGEHLTIIYTGIDKAEMQHPTKEEFLAIVEKVKNSEIKANEQKAIASSFVEGLDIKAGKIAKTGEGICGSTRWTLKNGLEVIVLHTEYEKAEIKLSLRKKGGLSTIPTDDIESFDSNIFTLYSSQRGLAGFTKTDVRKMLSGKNVSISPYIQSNYSGVNGTCSPEDIETALQMLYLNYTNPRFDKDEWDVAIKNLSAVLPNMLGTPDYAFSNHLYKNLYDSPRVSLISPDKLTKADFGKFETWYRKLFSEVKGAQLYIVGNVDIEAVKPLVEKYCGAIAKGKKVTNWDIKNIAFPVKGEKSDVFNTVMTSPKATVLHVYSGDLAFSVQKRVNLNAAEYILDMIYTNTLREEEGGTYGASVSTSCNYSPKGTGLIQIYFDTNVAQQEKLRELTVKGIKDLAANGPSDEQLLRAIENAKKNISENRIKNDWWMGVLKYKDSMKGDYDAEYEAAVNNITAEGIKGVLNEILSQNNFVEVVMLPEEKTE